MSDDLNSNHGASAPAVAPIHIWLVDDNKNLRSTMMELLNTCDGIQCKATFASPNAVLSTLASKPGPDVILLDIQMGNANGLDAIRPIKALSRSTQVLMFTSCGDSESKRLAMTFGATGFLLKQLPLERILDGIHEATLKPAPHLRRMPRAVSASVPTGDLPAATVMTNDAHSQQNGTFSWLRNCFSFIHQRRN